MKVQTSLPTLSILWQRRGTLVVDKPSMLSSEQRDTKGESVLTIVQKSYPDAQLPHRLDRMSCGALVVATERDALRFHNAAITDGEWGPKMYVARLEKPVDVGPRKAYLRRKGQRAHCVRSGGKPSFLDVLHCVPHDQGADVVVKLRTGRYHQIRAMMAHEGAPVRGDPLYGARNDVDPLLCHAALRFPVFQPDDDENDFVVVQSSFVDDFFSPATTDFLRSYIASDSFLDPSSPYP